MSKKIEVELVNLLTEGMHHNWNVYEITTVESCTAGMIASKIASVPGASNTLKQAYVTYCNEAKEKLVGVNKETINKFSVVSEEVAKEMAEGGLKAANADLAISVTGFAGPSNDPRVKDNTVCIGIAVNNINGKTETRTYKFIFKGKRNKIRQMAANKALRLAYLTLNEFLGNGEVKLKGRALQRDKGAKNSRKEAIDALLANNKVDDLKQVSKKDQIKIRNAVVASERQRIKEIEEWEAFEKRLEDLQDRLSKIFKD